MTEIVKLSTNVDKVVTLADLELRMENSRLEFAAALRQIAEGKHFKEAGFTSFESYCAQVHGISRSRGNQWIGYSKLADRLIESGIDHIPSEGALRPLNKLKRVGGVQLDDDAWADKVTNLVEIAIDTAKERNHTPQVTASHIESVMTEYAGIGKKTPQKAAESEYQQVSRTLKALYQSDALARGDGERFRKKHKLTDEFIGKASFVYEWLGEMLACAD